MCLILEFQPHRWKFLDVGHGDSAVIYMNDFHSDGVKTIVIDIVDADKLINELVQNEIKIVDMLIISHMDSDHCRGVNDFLEKFTTRGVIKTICYNFDRINPTQTMKLILKRFLELYHKQGIPILKGTNDTDLQKRELVSNNTTKLSLIYPNTAEETEAILRQSTNDMSIVCLYENEMSKIIFTGDLENNGWRRLLGRMPELECDILKMPHHGAFYNDENGMGTERILDTLKPNIAIISTGENKRYRHPSSDTIKLLKEKNVKIYCTEFTSLCHCNIDSFSRKCYGDVEIVVGDSDYVVKSESSNVPSLTCPACGVNVG